MSSSQSVIENWAKFYGLPSNIPLTIAQKESGLNAGATGDYSNGSPTSFGLFQLHQGGGQGDGFTQSQLLDPNLNSQIGIANMVTPYKQGVAKGLTGYPLVQYVAANSGHPDETGVLPASYNTGLAQSYTAVTGQKAVGTGTYNSSSTGAVQTGQVQIQKPTGIGGSIQSVGWMIVGVVIIGLGLWVAFNPFADLTNSLRQLGGGLNKKAQTVARKPLERPARYIASKAHNLNPKRTEKPKYVKRAEASVEKPTRFSSKGV